MSYLEARQGLVVADIVAKEQRAELIFRALPTAGADQHVDVVGGRPPTLVRRIDAQRIDATAVRVDNRG